MGIRPDRADELRIIFAHERLAAGDGNDDRPEALDDGAVVVKLIWRFELPVLAKHALRVAALCEFEVYERRDLSRLAAQKIIEPARTRGFLVDHLFHRCGRAIIKLRRLQEVTEAPHLHPRFLRSILHSQVLPMTDLLLSHFPHHRLHLPHPILHPTIPHPEER